MKRCGHIKQPRLGEGEGVLMRRDNSRATRTQLGQNSTRVSSTRNVNESSRATGNSTRKAREKLENILYIYKILKVFFLNLISLL